MIGKRILVVEDEPALREFLSLIIEETGARVMAVETATEGIRQLDKQPWAAVVTDVRTPGPFDGWDLAWMAYEQCPCMPVIVTSGGYSKVDMPLPPTAAFIGKPWSIDDIICLLMRCTTADQGTC
ncbi:response regulator [Pseudomonas putida]|uniref:response regulator n=1 Tax=Pseudomonas putida TaxID=303 RepID=UPI0018A99B92|nr:response regulator [Pseudomonas putida]MBF8726506.1 response regulator [Pseudomonas putida]